MAEGACIYATQCAHACCRKVWPTCTIHHHISCRAGSALVRSMSHGIQTRPGFHYYWLDSRRSVKTVHCFQRMSTSSSGSKRVLVNVTICLVIVCNNMPCTQPGMLFAPATRPCMSLTSSIYKSVTSSAPQGRTQDRL